MGGLANVKRDKPEGSKLSNFYVKKKIDQLYFGRLKLSNYET
jgi:hypothetical protein